MSPAPDAARPGGTLATDPPAGVPRPWWRWLFLLPGLAAVGYGAHGLLTAGGRVPLDSWLTWFVGSALLHDLVIAPVWIGLGWLAARFLPRAARSSCPRAASADRLMRRSPPRRGRPG